MFLFYFTFNRVTILNKIFNWKVSFIIFLFFYFPYSIQKYILIYFGSIFDQDIFVDLNLEKLSLANFDFIEIFKRYIYFWFNYLDLLIILNYL